MRSDSLPSDDRAGVDQVTLDLFSAEGAPSPVDLGTQCHRMPLWRPFESVAVKLSLRARRRAIGRILDARFSVRALQAIRSGNTRYWGSPRNEMARSIYAEAMREKQRLSHESDERLIAESAAVYA